MFMLTKSSHSSGKPKQGSRSPPRIHLPPDEMWMGCSHVHKAENIVTERASFTDNSVNWLSLMMAMAERHSEKGIFKINTF